MSVTMACPKVILVLGFLFVFGRTQAFDNVVRNPKFPAWYDVSNLDDSSSHSSQDGSSSQDDSSIRDHFRSTNDRRPTTVSVPDKTFSKYDSTNDPSIGHRREFRSTSGPENIASSTASDEFSHTSSKNDTKKKGFTNARPDLTNDDVIIHTKLPTRYPYSSVSSGISETHETGITGNDDPLTSYTRRKTTAHPSYTGRYSTPEEDTAYPHTSSKRSTASPTFFTGNTAAFRLRDPTTEPDTNAPDDRTYDLTPGPYTFTRKTGSSPTPWDPTGNCLKEEVDPSSLSPRMRKTTTGITTPTTDVPWWWRTTPNTEISTESTPDESTIPWWWWRTSPNTEISTRSTSRDPYWWVFTTPDPTDVPWWLRTTPTTGTPTTKQTKLKPKSGSDSVPGSLKNYFFIACESCNVFSKINVKKDTRNVPSPNEEVMFENMIENMETKIEAVLQNVLARIEELESLKP